LGRTVIANRALKVADQLKRLTTEEAIALLSSNGNLCKRPVVLGPKVTLVGFQQAEWDAAGL